MLRVQTDTGWWLITHGDHARLAAAFASHWGNSMFTPPHPRREVLDAIRVHDDGWAARDAHPGITRQGKPAAFSEELVGKYSAFEEIDLADYLSVREAALDEVEARSAYAALLVSMHTYNLLTERADRSTIAPNQLGSACCALACTQTPTFHCRKSASQRSSITFTCSRPRITYPC
jgi:hypothetical protein